MTISARPYAGDHELSRLCQWLCDANGKAPPHTYWHPGEMLWRTTFSTESERRRDIHLWEQDGQLVGFVWFWQADMASFFVHPMLRGHGTLEKPMLAWALDHARQFATGDEPRLWTTALETDHIAIEMFTAHGFERGDLVTFRMVQELDQPRPSHLLSDGWEIRAVDAPEMLAQRTAIHRDIWHPSRLTVDIYRHVRSFAAYMPDLDLVAIAPDGTFAAYCGGWLDQHNGIGLFEPVGTREAYRRRGLSTALLDEGMRRMQQRGAGSVWISTGAHNTQAFSLYTALGFRSTNEFSYGRRLS